MPYRLLTLFAAGALLLALVDLPYGYYQLLRWLVCGTAAYGAYVAAQERRNPWPVVLGGLAVLFNPVLPIYLGRGTWMVLDVLAAVLILASAFVIGRGGEGNQVTQCE